MYDNKPKTTVFGAIELLVIGLIAALVILLAVPVMHDLLPEQGAPSAADLKN